MKESSELSELRKTLKSLKRGREGFKAIAAIAFNEDVESNTIMSDRLDRRVSNNRLTGSYALLVI